MLGDIDSTLGGLRRGVNSAWCSGALAWLAATLAASTAIGAIVGTGRVKFAAVPFAVVVASVFARVPIAGYIAVLWSVATAIDILAPPQVGLSSLRFAPAEILLWLSLGCLMFLPRAVRAALADLSVRRESLVMATFLSAVIGGVAVGIENGASLHAAAFDMRFMLFYAAFWPGLAALALPRHRWLAFKLVSAGAVAVVVIQIAQVIVGPSTHLFLIAPSDVASTLTSDGTGFLRVRPPGLTSVYIVACFALARVLWGPARGRLVGWGMTAVALAGVLLSLNRNMLIGIVLGVSVAALVAPQRRRFVVMVAGLSLVLSSLIIAEGSAIGSTPVASRIASITNYSELKTQTLDDRFYENRIAVERIRAHPFGGLGWGPAYGAMITSSDAGFPVSQPRSFMHEQYLWIWLRAGIIGLLALVAMLALGILNGVHWLRARHATEDGWLGAGVVVSLVAMAASSNVAIYLTPPDSTVPLVAVLALGAVLHRDLARMTRAR